jgi:hypothetical protein
VKPLLIAALSGIVSIAAWIGAEKLEAHFDTANTPAEFRCIKGISYVQFAAGVVVELDAAGRIVTCSKPETTK